MKRRLELVMVLVLLVAFTGCFGGGKEEGFWLNLNCQQWKKPLPEVEQIPSR